MKSYLQLRHAGIIRLAPGPHSRFWWSIQKSEPIRSARYSAERSIARCASPTRYCLGWESGTNVVQELLTALDMPLQFALFFAPCLDIHLNQGRAELITIDARAVIRQ
jgi:hypothetical protein